MLGWTFIPIYKIGTNQTCLPQAGKNQGKTMLACAQSCPTPLFCQAIATESAGFDPVIFADQQTQVGWDHIQTLPPWPVLVKFKVTLDFTSNMDNIKTNNIACPVFGIG